MATLSPPPGSVRACAHAHTAAGVSVCMSVQNGRARSYTTSIPSAGVVVDMFVIRGIVLFYTLSIPRLHLPACLPADTFPLCRSLHPSAPCVTRVRSLKRSAADPRATCKVPAQKKENSIPAAVTAASPFEGFKRLPE